MPSTVPLVRTVAKSPNCAALPDLRRLHHVQRSDVGSNPHIAHSLDSAPGNVPHFAVLRSAPHLLIHHVPDLREIPPILPLHPHPQKSVHGKSYHRTGSTL